ncbi:MAG: hypothetical protein KJ058_07835 [Thermoanaerobaculia bacterium]|nr:hypothetical protein [Thermoanaerobaculia bacterium]
MARPGLFRNKKFIELAQEIGCEARALGHLEFLWQAQYDCCEATIGSAAVLEHHARWRGKRGRLAQLLLSSGFVDVTEGGVFVVHDFWHHAPDYVRKRRIRENEREDKGRRLADSDRSLTGHLPVGDRSVTGNPAVSDHPLTNTPAPAPAPTPAPAPAPPKKEGVGGDSLSLTPPGEPRTIHLAFPCRGGTEWGIDDEELEKLQTLYPEFDVLAMAMQALRWVEADTKRRKSLRGCRKFVHDWLRRDVDAGKGIPSAPRPATPGRNGNGVTDRFIGRPNYTGEEVWDGKQYVPREEFVERFPGVIVPLSPVEIEEQAAKASSTAATA